MLFALLLSLAASTPDSLPDDLRARLAELTVRRARLVEERRVELDESGEARGVEKSSWRVRIGADTLSHWEFAQLASGATGRAVPDSMRLAFDPPNRRRSGVQLGLFLGGSVAVALASLLATGSYLEARDCEDCVPTKRYIASAITGGAGLALLGAGTLYRINTIGARDPRGDYFTRRELELLVDEYNRAIVAQLGLPEGVLETASP